MINLLIRLCLVAVAMLIAAYLIPGIKVKSFGTAFIAAIVLGLINAFIKPILVFLTLPITWLTLGLFIFVINGILFKFVAELIEGLDVDGWLNAILGSAVISVVSFVLTRIFL